MVVGQRLRRRRPLARRRRRRRRERVGAVVAGHGERGGDGARAVLPRKGEVVAPVGADPVAVGPPPLALGGRRRAVCACVRQLLGASVFL